MTAPNDQHPADAYDAEHGPTREDYKELDEVGIMSEPKAYATTDEILHDALSGVLFDPDQLTRWVERRYRSNPMQHRSHIDEALRVIRRQCDLRDQMASKASVDTKP